jgi:DNA end-binding protein Ku
MIGLLAGFTGVAERNTIPTKEGESEMSVRSVGNVDLSVGLVSCPVKMIGVTDSHDRKGSMYHRHDDGSFHKVKMPKLCEGCGESVPTGEISKGFEENGDMVMLSPDELETVKANTEGAVEVPHFVFKDQVDPMLFADQNIYRLVPDVKRGRQAVTTYRMIRRTLIDEGKVGVVQYTRWGRNRLGLLDVEPTDDGGVLVIRNMMWPDELRATDGLLPAGSDDDIDPRLMPVMQEVVKSMTTDWNPTAYLDAYTGQLNAAIEAKAAGSELPRLATDDDTSIDDVADLLAKLQQTADARAPKKAAPKRKATPKREVA